MKNLLPHYMLFLGAVIAGSALGQSSPSLILETEPDETEILLEGALIISANGTIRGTPVDSSICQATSSCEGVTVSVSNFDSALASQRTITVNEGSSIDLSWSSSGATECSAQGNYAVWSDRAPLPTDSRDASVAQRRIVTSSGDASSSPYTVELQCSNGSVSSQVGATERLTLEIQEVVPPSPTSCEGRAPISGWTRLTTGPLSCLLGDSSADCRTWSPKLWPNSFLQSRGLTKKIMTNVSDRKQYVAIEFNTNEMSSFADGRVNFESAGGSVRKEPVFVTISKCPGDFNAEQPNGCYFTPRSVLLWRAPDSSSSANCVLEPDTRYYFNMLSSASPSGTAPSDIEPVAACDSALCGVLVQPN